MRKTAAKKWFKTDRNIATILGITRQAVTGWGEIVPIRYVPKLIAAAPDNDLEPAFEDYLQDKGNVHAEQIRN